MTPTLRRLWRHIRALFRLAAAGRGPRRWNVLAAGLLAITFWQMGFSRLDVRLDDTYKITAASGVHNDRNFVYYFWYSGLFPVASLDAVDCGEHWICPDKNESSAPAKVTQADALVLMKTSSKSFVNDIRWTWYAGDRGKILLYMLDAWLKGAPWKPSMMPMNRFAFITALALIFAAFWWIRRPALGGLVVLFLGSDPFQVFEVHGHDNVFSWNITTALLVLALHVPLLADARLPRRAYWVWPIVTGALVATIRTFRSEPAPILASAAVAYALLRTLPRLHRAGLVAAMAVSVLVTQTLWNRWFDAKQAEATAAVTAIGGHPFPGAIRHYHHFWHPVWCGLGDFDKKHGYAWDDVRALQYAAPILTRDFHEYVPIANFAPTRNDADYWDADHVYKKLPYDIPHYNDIIRDKVLGDIKSDPLWYADILYKRVRRVLGGSTPVRVTGWTSWLTVPYFNGFWLLPMLPLLFMVRGRLFLRLVLFTIPTTAPAIIVYSDRGMAYYGVFHLVLAAALTLVLATAACVALRRLLRRRHAH